MHVCINTLTETALQSTLCCYFGEKTKWSFSIHQLIKSSWQNKQRFKRKEQISLSTLTQGQLPKSRSNGSLNHQIPCQAPLACLSPLQCVVCKQDLIDWEHSWWLRNVPLCLASYTSIPSLRDEVRRHPSLDRHDPKRWCICAVTCNLFVFQGRKSTRKQPPQHWRFWHAKMKIMIWSWMKAEFQFCLVWLTPATKAARSKPHGH